MALSKTIKKYIPRFESRLTITEFIYMNVISRLSETNAKEFKVGNTT